MKIANLETPQIISAIEKKSPLTQEGGDWLTAALDPFHDSAIRIAGLPDSEVGNSVVRVFKNTVALTVPAALAGANFDVHIFTMPIQTGTIAVNATQDVTAVSNTGFALNNTQMTGGGVALTWNLGLITVAYVPTGQDIFNEGTGWNTNAVLVAYWLPDNVIENSALNSRLITGGFEVVNTTPELYRGGACTVYSTFQGDYATEMIRSARTAPGTTAPFNGFGMAKNFRMPPLNASQAIQCAGSQTWTAIEGAYVPFKLNLERIRPCYKNASLPVFYGPGLSGGTTPYIWVAQWNVDTVTNVMSFQPNMVEAGVHISGAYFTGLTPQSTLQLTYKVGIETFPTSNPSELALATPTASFDSLALELYEETIYRMPPGCRVTENPSGEWWSSVGSALWKAVKIAAPMAANLILPGSGTILSGLGSAIDTGLSSIGKLEKEKKAKQVNKVTAKTLKNLQFEEQEAKELLAIENKNMAREIKEVASERRRPAMKPKIKNNRKR